MSLSKNNIIVYEIFNLNPFKAFDVNELLETVNKNEQVMSKRTVFRSVKSLTEIGYIYCCNLDKGVRKFQLLKNNYYAMICEKCKVKTFRKIEDFNIIEKMLDKNNDFYIKGMAIEIRGICEKCR